MKAQRYIAFRFTVEGAGQFPIDMIRFDRCVPFDVDDLVSMQDFRRPGKRCIQMIAFSPSGYKPEPTALRWRSFGWTVVTGSVHLIAA